MVWLNELTVYTRCTAYFQAHLVVQAQRTQEEVITTRNKFVPGLMWTLKKMQRVRILEPGTFEIPRVNITDEILDDYKSRHIRTEGISHDVPLDEDLQYICRHPLCETTSALLQSPLLKAHGSLITSSRHRSFFQCRRGYLLLPS